MSLLRSFLVFALSASACLSWPSLSVGGEIAHLTLQSQPGSYIGGGKNWDIIYTPQNSQSFFAEINQVLPNGQPDYISFIMGTVTGGPDNTYTTLEFSTAKLGTPLQPGTYDNAQRASFAQAGHPGLDVTFQNAGSNMLTGSFTINELSFYRDQNNNPEIGSFSVSFAQNSDNNSSKITGTFSFQTVPEPPSLVMLILGTTVLAAGFGWSRIKRSAPSSAAGA